MFINRLHPECKCHLSNLFPVFIFKLKHSVLHARDRQHFVSEDQKEPLSKKYTTISSNFTSWKKARNKLLAYDPEKTVPDDFCCLMILAFDLDPSAIDLMHAKC